LGRKSGACEQSKDMGKVDEAQSNNSHEYLFFIPAESTALIAANQKV
jgi:hypothetical protein